MKYQKEVILNEYPNPITYECIKEIKKQMKYNVCKIKVGKEQGTGFFCKIPFPDKNNMLPVFITNNHIINKKLLYKDNSWIELDIKNETNTKKIELNNRMKYTNEVYDITISLYLITSPRLPGTERHPSGPLSTSPRLAIMRMLG